MLPYYFYMCDMIPDSEHWRVSVAEAQALQHAIMGYLPGYATPRIVCDVPYVGKRWVHQIETYDRERGISYWTKNYRTGDRDGRPGRPEPQYAYYDPIHTLPPSGQAWWQGHGWWTRSRRRTWRPPSPARPPRHCSERQRLDCAVGLRNPTAADVTAGGQRRSEDDHGDVPTAWRWWSAKNG